MGGSNETFFRTLNSSILVYCPESVADPSVRRTMAGAAAIPERAEYTAQDTTNVCDRSEGGEILTE